jgi:hypothetical protein
VIHFFSFEGNEVVGKVKKCVCFHVKKNNFFIILNYFDVFILKINFKNKKKYYLKIFLNKKTTFKRYLNLREIFFYFFFLTLKFILYGEIFFPYR